MISTSSCKSILYLSVPDFDPIRFPSSFVSKPPTAKYASIRAKNSTRATTTVESSAVNSRRRDLRRRPEGNARNDNRFSFFSVFYRMRASFDPSRASTHYVMCAAFFESSNFIKTFFRQYLARMQFAPLFLSFSLFSRYYLWRHCRDEGQPISRNATRSLSEQQQFCAINVRRV